MWKRFKGQIKGTLVEGDPSVRATTIWNWLLMKLWGWKTVAVFAVGVGDAEHGYRIGYLPMKNGDTLVGQARLNIEIFPDLFFRVRIGREPCTFFALNLSGAEIALRLIAREDTRTGAHRDVPLR
jgi:hypothetical protein